MRLELIGLVGAAACAGTAAAQSLSLESFGPEAGSTYGQCVAAPGDLDGDGTPDLVAGAPYVGGVAAGTGRVQAVSGADAQVLWMHDGQPGQRLGWRVASLGDVDLDGVPDVAASCEPFTQAGRVVVLSGASGAQVSQMLGALPPDAYGDALAGVADFDGDGLAEVLVGAWGYAGGFATGKGAAFLYSGATGGLVAQWVSPRPGDHLGDAVAGLDDWDGDGRAELALGVPGADLGVQVSQLDRGKVQVISSITGQPLAEVWGWEPLGFFGQCVAAAGDLDGDGRGDLLATSPSGAWGRAYRAPDAAELFNFASEDFPAQTASLLFGRELAGPGDMDGDGLGDVVAAETTWVLPGAPAEYMGRVYAFSGATGAPLFHVDGEQDWEFLGRGLAGGLDLQGDGLSDLLVGAWGWAGPLGDDQGRVLAISGSHGSFVAYGSGACVHAGLGLPTGGGLFPVLVEVTGAPPSAPGLLLIGREATDVPVAGVHLLLTPILGLVPIVTDASGAVMLKSKLPPIGGSPIVLRTQAFFAGPPHAASNGLTWTVDTKP